MCPFYGNKAARLPCLTNILANKAFSPRRAKSFVLCILKGHSSLGINSPYYHIKSTNSWSLIQLLSPSWTWARKCLFFNWQNLCFFTKQTPTPVQSISINVCVFVCLSLLSYSETVQCGMETSGQRACSKNIKTKI